MGSLDEAKVQPTWSSVQATAVLKPFHTKSNELLGVPKAMRPGLILKSGKQAGCEAVRTCWSCATAGRFRRPGRGTRRGPRSRSARTFGAC